MHRGSADGLVLAQVANVIGVDPFELRSRTVDLYLNAGSPTGARGADVLRR